MTTAVDENLARRREIGHQRRERTRLRLLTAAARVLAEYGEQKATIDDFVHAAGVARGTFYYYYRTVDELIDDLWLHIGHDPFVEIQDACASISSPAERLTALTRLVFDVTAHNNAWGWVVFAMSASDETVNADLLSFPRPLIEEGQRCGEFRVEDSLAATDLTVSAVRGAMQRILCEERQNDYAIAICRLLLRTLGMNETEMERIVNLPLPPFGDLGDPVRQREQA